MQYLLDTNIWILALAGDEAIRRFLRSATQTAEISYSVISRIEVLGYPGMMPEVEAAALRLLGYFQEIQLDSAVVRQTILFRKSARIKTPDAIIAASAVTNRATLVTRNINDFKQLGDLSVLDPFQNSGDPHRA